MIPVVLYVNKEKSYYNNTTNPISIILTRLWNFSQSQPLNNELWQMIAIAVSILILDEHTGIQWH
jgi:hypothetical protein